MKKKILGGLSTVAITVATLPLFAAFEAHVVNVTARIENALFVPIESIDFGTAFPQERLDKNFTVSLSDAFLEAASSSEYQWATGVTSFSQALRKDGGPVLPDRSDPTKALGPAESLGTPYDNPVLPGTFVSLGFGGSITLSFDQKIVNVGGSEIKDFEVTGGDSYPDEKVRVEASQDGISWTLLNSSLARDGEVDLGPLPWAKYVRLTDVSDASLFEDAADGYDVDAVRTTGRNRAGIVDYFIRQKPKCVDKEDSRQHPQVGEDAEGNFVCPDGSTMMPLLCPYLSKHELTTDPNTDQENDSIGINAFHGLPGPWVLQTSKDTQVEGQLSSAVGDLNDTWNVDLKVPCFNGQCAQDWPSFVHEFNPEANPDAYKADPADEHKVFGCDLWVEVNNIE